MSTVGKNSNDVIFRLIMILLFVGVVMVMMSFPAIQAGNWEKLRPLFYCYLGIAAVSSIVVYFVTTQHQKRREYQKAHYKNTDHSLGFADYNAYRLCSYGEYFSRRLRNFGAIRSIFFTSVLVLIFFIRSIQKNPVISVAIAFAYLIIVTIYPMAERRYYYKRMTMQKVLIKTIYPSGKYGTSIVIALEKDPSSLKHCAVNFSEARILEGDLATALVGRNIKRAYLMNDYEIENFWVKRDTI